MSSIPSQPRVVELQSPRSDGLRRLLCSRWTFLGLQVLDLLTTMYAFRAGALEVNPLVAHTTGVFGRFGGVLASKLIAIVIAMGVRKRLWIVNMIYIAIVGWNLIMIADMVLQAK